jgi:hypothetical protein
MSHLRPISGASPVVFRATQEDAQNALVVRIDPQGNSLPCPFRHLSMGRDILPLDHLVSLRLHYPTSALLDELGNAPLRIIVEGLGPAGQLLLCQIHNSPRVREFFSTRIQSMINSVRTTFFELKRERLIAQRKIAFRVYFKGGGLENRKKVTAALAQAGCVWNSETQATLDAYWALMSRDPRPNAIELNEAEICDSIDQAGRAIFKEFEEDTSPNPNYGSQLKAYLSGELESWIETLKTKHKNLTDERAQKELAYLIFKVELLYNTVVRCKLQGVLKPLIKKMHKLAENKQKQNREEVEHNQKELSSARCCIYPLLLRTQWPFAKEEEIQAQLKINRAYRIKVFNKYLEALEASTFEDCLKWAQQEWGFNSEELQKTLDDNPLTPFDRKVVEIFSYIVPEEEEDSIDGLMSLDLVSQDVVTYLTEKLRARDGNAYRALCSYILLDSLTSGFQENRH